MQPGTETMTQPAGVELSRVAVGRHRGLRLMVILRAPGCVYALHTGGCTNCGFWHHLTTAGQPVFAEDYLAQLEVALAQHSDDQGQILEVDLFCSGSLLADEEVPAEARTAMLARLARLPALRRVVVESRPEFVTAEALAPLVEALAPSQAELELAVGLETADDKIRNDKIRKGFTLEQFEQAAAVLAALEVGLVVYLLQKPMGLNEQQAVDDVVASGDYLVGLQERLKLRSRVALEPTFVPQGTPLHAELVAGRYNPPSLWSVLRVTSELASMGLEVHVGLSNEGMPADTVPAGCPLCTERLRATLARFNASQDRELLGGFWCSCLSPADTE